MRWIFLKAKLGVIFNLQNSQLLPLSLPTEEIFQVHSKSWQVFQQSIFVLSGEKCNYQGHWIRNFRFFLLVFWFTSSFRKIWMSLIRYGFFSVLAAIIREHSDKRPWIENGEDSPFIHQQQTWKAIDVSAADWLYQTHLKKYGIFLRVWAFQGCESRCIWLSLLGLSEQRLPKNHQRTAKKILCESSSWSRRTPIFDPHLANTND